MPFGVEPTKSPCILCNKQANCFALPCDKGHKYCEPCLIANYKAQFLLNQKWECGMKTSEGKICTYNFYDIEDGVYVNTTILDEVDELKNKVLEHNDPNIQRCPGCNAVAEIAKNSQSVIMCKNCKIYFCYYCLMKQGNGNCTNQDCNLSIITQMLATSPTISISEKVKGPKTRACTNCGLLLDHVSGCKHSTCRGCSTKFCHVCLAPSDKWGVNPCGGAWDQCPIAGPQTLTGKISKRDLGYNDI